MALLTTTVPPVVVATVMFWTLAMRAALNYPALLIARPRLHIDRNLLRINRTRMHVDR